MKREFKLPVLLLLTFVLGSVNLQAQNPYKSLGVEMETLTLSKGKYLEFFPNDSLVQIGSVIFDTRNNLIISFVQRDTAYSEANLEPEVSSRFLQTDPYAADYPNLSPYSYVANNPLLYTDPTGKYIVDSEGNRVDVTTTQDEDGNHVNSYKFADGTDQSVKDDFDANGGTILNAMSMTEEGRSGIGSLTGAEHSIGLVLSDETMITRKDGKTEIRYGKTKMDLVEQADGSFTTDHAIITVYKGTARTIAGQPNQLSGNTGLRQQSGVIGIIGQTGVHEEFHATNPLNMTQTGQNAVYKAGHNIEKAPNAAGLRYTKQFLKLMNNRK